MVNGLYMMKKINIVQYKYFFVFVNIHIYNIEKHLYSSKCKVLVTSCSLQFKNFV